MKTKLFIIALLYGVFSWGQSIFTNPLTFASGVQSSPYTAGQTVDPNITVSGIARGSGIIGAAAANRYSANAWSTTTLDTNDYFEFTLTPNAGYKIDFASFVYTSQVSSGTPSHSFRCSVDGYASDIGTATTTGTTISLSSASYQGITTAITFRFYSYGLAAASTTFSINDFTFNGVVSSTTTPAPPVVTASSFSGTVGAAFSNNVVATNSPTSYAISSGTLPAGLSLNTTTGLISGTPTSSGSSSVSITATNAGGTSAAATISFTIAPSSSCVNQGFSAGITPPSGWVFTGITGTYTAAGNYGAGSPSLSMDTVNDAITTEILPVGNGASQFSFWFKGQGINAGSTSTLKVDGFDGTSWTNIDVINSATLIASSGTAVTKIYNSGSTPVLNSGYVRFRLTYLKGTGNLAIDDVTINCTSIAVNTPVVSASSEITTLGSAYSYYVSATNFPTSYAIVAGSLPPGLTFNTATGQISGATTLLGAYSIDVTATNGGGTSVSATISFTVNAYVAGCYNVNFEDGTAKSSYVLDVVTLNGKTWSLSEGLIGNTNTTSDYGTGNYCVRMRSNNYANLTLMQDKPNGISTVSFDYKKYAVGTYTNQIFNVEYSKDSGNTWIYIGSITPNTTASATYTSPFINQSGPIRVRIRFASGTEDNNVRLNIDNLSICDYVAATKDIEVFGNATTILNNSITVSENNNTYFSANFFVGDTPLVKTFVITNTGTGTLTLSGLSLSSTAFYTITSGLSSTSLTTGQSATFSITFNSASAGLKSATVTINSNDPTDGSYNFLISTKVYNYIQCTLLAPSIIAQNDFDSNGGYTYTQGINNVNTSVAGGTNYGNSRATKSNMFTGTNSFQSLNNPNTITFSTLDTSSYQNLELDFNLGAYTTTNSTAAYGMDTEDYVTVSVSVDGGPFYEQLKMTGNNNSIFDINNGLSANKTEYKANSTNPSRLGPLSNSTNTMSSLFKITKLPSASSLVIKITLASNNANEVWAIDNIIIKGQLPLNTTWDGTTWSSGIPTPDSKAIFNGNYNSTSNGGSVHACECQINSGKTVDVATADHLEIQSDLTNNGTLNIANNASLVQVNDDADNTGNISYTRTVNVRHKDYVYWSSPVAGFNTNNISTGTSSNYIWKWDPAVANSNANWGDWYAGANATMNAGTGVIVRGPDLYSDTVAAPLSAVFNNGKPNNGIINAPIARGPNTTVFVSPALPPNGTNGIPYTNLDDNQNLIGNPYPSSINAIDFLNANTNILGYINLWTHGTLPSSSISNPYYNSFGYNYTTNDYITYDSTGSSTGPSTFNGYIAGGQSFFVTMVDGAADATQTVFFNNAMRNKTYSNSQFYKNSSSTTSADNSRIWLDLVDANLQSSRILVGYIDGATNTEDRMYDAYSSIDGSNQIYSTLGNLSYNIQGRQLPFDELDKVPLGISISTAGDYTVAIGAVDGIFSQNQNIYLEDKLLNVIHDLRNAPYHFNSNAGIFNDRFVLRYTTESLSANNFNSNNNVIVASHNSQINIKSYTEKMTSATVYDLLGRTIATKTNASENEIIFNTMVKNQAVIVKIQLENGEIVTRKVVL